MRQYAATRLTWLSDISLAFIISNVFLLLGHVHTRSKAIIYPVDQADCFTVYTG